MQKNQNTYENLKAGLYIVPTPIGNLDDITIRALKILTSADIVACEDTRHTGNLLKAYNISQKKLISYFEHNELKRTEILLAEIENGKCVALVSDAGTPGISDPGFIIIREAIKRNLEIIPLPGATAFIPALLASGFAADNFLFLGFPPQKKGRKTFLLNLAKQPFTTILYESPHRILKLMDELSEYCGVLREICICREISKVYEEYIRGTLEEVKLAMNNKNAIKGEFVIIINAYR